jgi:hypothetical protein
MKLLLSFFAFVISGMVSPTVIAEQQDSSMERMGQKARPGPTIHSQQTPIVLAQATTADATQPDYILKLCKQTESVGDPQSAMRAVDPAGMLAVYLEWNKGAENIDLKTIKTTLLEGTKHGKIITGTSNTGRTAYGYDAEPEYVGNDRAVFMAEFEGKRYKIVIELKVFLQVIENVPSACPPPKLIKVNRKPVSGALGDGIKEKNRGQSTVILL